MNITKKTNFLTISFDKIMYNIFKNEARFFKNNPQIYREHVKIKNFI